MIYFKHIKLGLVPIRFKYVNLEQQFFELLDPRLRAMTLEFAYLSRRQFEITPVITHIYRTQGQQNSFYRNKIEAGYCIRQNGQVYYSLDKKRPTLSVHQVVPVRGIDARDRIYSEAQINYFDKEFEKWFPYRKGKESLVHHNVVGSHIHLQVPAEIKAG